MTDQLEAQLADAEARREEACEEANTAAEERDGYRRELARVRARVRELEGQLRAERHEHAETRMRLARAQAAAELPDLVNALLSGARLHSEPRPSEAYDLNPTAEQLASFRSHR